MKVFRIGKTKYASGFFDGEGAYKYGGRWNTQGTRIVYTAESLALATLELVVHFDGSQVQNSYSFTTVEFDESLVKDVRDFVRLPNNWNNSPAPLAIQRIGDKWVQSGETVILRIPTAILPLGFNYLINIAHRDFASLKIGKPVSFTIDPRLVRLSE